MKPCAAAGMLFLMATQSVAAAGDDPVTVVALGDMPYGGSAVRAQYHRLLATINDVAPAVTLHVGDLKSSGTPCSDARLRQERRSLARVTGPVLLIHGDTHVFRFDQPLPTQDNFYRLEVYASGRMAAVRLDLRPGSATPISVSPLRASADP